MTNIKEFAAIREEIQDKSLNLLKSLAILYMHPNSSKKNLLEYNVWSSFHNIDAPQKVSSKFILRCGWKAYKSQIRMIMVLLSLSDYEENPDPDREFNYSGFHNIAKKYMKWIAQCLEDTKQISLEETILKIRDLNL